MKKKYQKLKKWEKINFNILLEKATKGFLIWKFYLTNFSSICFTVIFLYYSTVDINGRQDNISLNYQKFFIPYVEK
jgi:hypothetical protein